MKVRYVESNPKRLTLQPEAIDYYEYLHNAKSPVRKNLSYWPAQVGYESSVYAMSITGGHVLYYIKDPLSYYIGRAASVCFEVIDPRISRYWQFKHEYIEVSSDHHPLGKIFPSTWFAIKEWVEEPRFLEFYVDGKEREVGILENAAKLIENEFE